MNNELRRAINAKAMLRRKHQREKTTEAWNKFKMQRNKVNKLKRQSIKIYFEKHCKNINTDTTNFWSSVKPYFTDKSSKSCQNVILFENDKLLTIKHRLQISLMIILLTLQTILVNLNLFRKCLYLKLRITISLILVYLR